MVMIAMMSPLCVVLMTLMAAAVISQAAHQSCQEDFLIRQSVIIRTEDSRRRGASFLNVTEVAETSQCLQRCCNKLGCNAAVYDDKNRNCYLFDCGRLDDYRCLFTSHTRFISATLRDGRDVLELDQWGSQNRHAAELNNLKDTATDEHLQQVHPPASKHQEQHHQDQLHQEQFPREQLHREIGQLPREETLPTLSLHVSAKKGGRRCGRHQFECHSGECIAIYNACDGIAQCQDASDEHAELGCPPELADEAGVLGAASAIVVDNSAALQNPARARLADIDNDINFDIQGPFWDGLARNAADPGGIFAHRRNSVLGTADHFPLAADSVTNNNRINSVQPINWPRYGSGTVSRYPGGTRYDDMYPVWSGGTGAVYSEMRQPSVPQQYQHYRPYQNPVARLMGPHRHQLTPDRPQLTPDRPQLTPDGGAPQGNVMDRAAHMGEDQQLENNKADISVSRPVNRTITVVANNSVEQKQQQMTGSDIKKVAAPSGPTISTSILEGVEFRLSDLNALAERQSSEKRTAATLLCLGIAMCLAVIILGVVRMRCCRLTREARKRLAHDSDYLINGLYL